MFLKKRKPKNVLKKLTALEVIEATGKEAALGGKVALITGANSGIGYEAARALAVNGCHVVMACRNMKTANEARDKIIQQKPSAKVDCIQVDLNAMASVETCANTFLDMKIPLHMLILNAGLLGATNYKTPDGFETHYQVNHLAHFYLTQLLTDKLVQSAPARVIVVSSMAHQYATIQMRRPDHFTKETVSPETQSAWGNFGHYAGSKLAQILFSRELNDRLQDKGVTAYSLHPGVVDTNVFRSPESWFGGYIATRMKSYMKTPEQGAATTVYLAVADSIEQNAGQYFCNCRVRKSVKPSRNKDNAEKAWQVSEELINDFKQSRQMKEAEHDEIV